MLTMTLTPSRGKATILDVGLDTEQMMHGSDKDCKFTSSEAYLSLLQSFPGKFALTGRLRIKAGRTLNLRPRRLLALHHAIKK